MGGKDSAINLPQLKLVQVSTYSIQKRNLYVIIKQIVEHQVQK
ncbi:hypothetical protein T02_7807 [Trichinella nativa]|uniref:Uncharacterized protein n=1 Tax=Trichinella nativa TaxID=6335 RepID=A0A0V1KHH4_9BILA|nr:hypothetical protein T02_7807 [Trichinella nativa]